MTIDIGRREFLAGIGGSTATWPLTARALPGDLPVIALVNGGSADASEGYAMAFRKGLGETGLLIVVLALVKPLSPPGDLSGQLICGPIEA